jgi:peptide/nickel transport system ATP-binding protein
MVMYAGQIVEHATAKQAVFDPLHPYSKGLMGSIIVPESGLRDIKLTAIPGVPPNLKNPPAGCRFAERCQYARAVCRGTSVALSAADPNRLYRCVVPEAELRRLYQNGD